MHQSGLLRPAFYETIDTCRCIYSFHKSQNTKCKQQHSVGVKKVCTCILLVRIQFKSMLNEARQCVLMVSHKHTLIAEHVMRGSVKRT